MPELSRSRTVFQNIRRNWKLKLGSLLVALTLAWYVEYSRNVVRVLNVRVEPPEIPANMILSSRVPGFMNVEFYGAAEQIDFNNSEFRIQLINLAPETGENVFRTVLIPDPPAGIGASYQEEIRLKLDRRMERTLIVDPVFDKSQAEGFEIVYLSTTPSTFNLSGPHSILSELARVRTQPIILPPEEGTRTGRILLSEMSPFLRPGPDQSLEVQYTVRLVKRDRRLSLAEMAMQDDDIYVFQDQRIRCLNDIDDIQMEALGRGSVDVYIHSESPVSSDEIEVRAFCPVYFDVQNRSIKPAFLIENVPLRILDRGNRSDIEVLMIDPARVSMQFERTEPIRETAPERQMQQGLREHLMR